MIMTKNYRKLFGEELSDEVAYHLSELLYHLAWHFEEMSLGKIQRHCRSLMGDGNNAEGSHENDVPDPPF